MTPGVLLQNLGAQPLHHSAPGTHPSCVRPLTGDGHPKRGKNSSPPSRMEMWVTLLSQCVPRMQDAAGTQEGSLLCRGDGSGGFVPCPSDHSGHGFDRFRVLSPRFTCLYRFAVAGFTNAQGSLSDIWESLCCSHLLPKDAFWAVTGSNWCQKLLKATVPGRLIQYKDHARKQDTGCLEEKLSEEDSPCS